MCSLYRPPSILNPVFGNTAVLYALPTSSGSHHFVTTRDLCPGRSSTYQYPSAEFLTQSNQVRRIGSHQLQNGYVYYHLLTV